MMYIMQGVTTEWHVQVGELGLLASVSGIGQVIGSWAFGRLSDLRGRRFSLLWAVTLTTMVGFLSAVAPTFGSFLVLRGVINIGLSGALPVAFTLLSEFLPPKERPRWTSFLYSSFGVGRLLTAFIAWLLLDLSWRTYLVVIAVPSGSLLLLQKWIPETPQFLYTRGKPKEAQDVLDALSVRNGVKATCGKFTRVKVAGGDDAEAATEQGEEAVACRVWTCSALVLCPLWMFTALGSEWFNWILKILLANGMTHKTAYTGMLLFNTNELVVPLLLGLLPAKIILRRARAVLVVVCLLAASLLLVLAAFVHHGAPAALLFILSIAAGYCNIALWVLLYTITPSFFPARVRGTGFGTCVVFNRLGYIIGPLCAAELLKIRQAFVPAICACCCVVAAVLSASLRPITVDA